MSSLVKYKKSIDQQTIWQVVEGKNKNANGNTLKFYIQEIPESRYEEVLDFMTNIMLQDELTCASLSK